MEALNDINSKTSISRHLLYISISVFMVTLAIMLTISTLELKNYIKRSETLAQQYISLNERTNQAIERPLTLISEMIYGIVFKSLGEADIISAAEADSLVASSLKNIKQDSQTLAVLANAIFKSEDNVLGFGKRTMQAKMSEADAALGSIRTQLRVYYGENGTYPYSRERTYVMGATWNDFRKGELTGKYFSDSSFTYYSPDGDSFIITCAAGDVLKSNRTLDNRGNLSGGF